MTYNAFASTEPDRLVVFREIAMSIPAMTKDEASKAADIIDFLYDYPGLINGTRAGRPNILLEHGIKQVVGKWLQGRKRITAVSVPKTIPDPAVSVVLGVTGHLGASHAAVAAHLECMAAENAIGNMLEQYIAETLEKRGWVWCSGEVVKAVDFIKFDNDLNTWIALQVKNRSNSENSSSAAIRAGTEITKWHRIHAYTGTTFWNAFPEANTGLSEEGFLEYIRRALG